MNAEEHALVNRVVAKHSDIKDSFAFSINMLAYDPISYELRSELKNGLPRSTLSAEFYSSEINKHGLDFTIGDHYAIKLHHSDAGVSRRWNAVLTERTVEALANMPTRIALEFTWME